MCVDDREVCGSGDGGDGVGVGGVSFGLYI